MFPKFLVQKFFIVCNKLSRNLKLQGHHFLLFYTDLKKEVLDYVCIVYCCLLLCLLRDYSANVLMRLFLSYIKYCVFLFRFFEVNPEEYIIIVNK